ncbi:MAG: Holliday junction branch migration protein RuvA [Parcubacteria group bacterium]|nr:MAG: Holliday junction branch migration protein RuvA [Parcubacteria group bacterium]
MIAYIKGQIIQLGQKSITVFVGGLGYEVFLTPKGLATLKVNQEACFFVYSHIKEDAHDLYGFTSDQELDFFKKLISVSGVGPKSALNILGLGEAAELKRAIGQGDTIFLQQVSGIGKKTAERLVVELREKFIDEISGQISVGGGDQQVREALISLGYKDKEAAEAIKHISTSSGDLASRIKEALRAVPK